MNKDSILIFKGEDKYLTYGQMYPVLAGKGDGVPRNDDKLGAFIQNDHAFVIEDDKGFMRNLSFKSGDWEMYKETAPTHHEKAAYKNPIPLTREPC